MVEQNYELAPVNCALSKQEVDTLLNNEGIRLELIEDGLRKKYLSRLSSMKIASVGNQVPLEYDLMENVRLFHIAEIVYAHHESITDKFNTVFNTLSLFDVSVFILIDSDGDKTDFYLGIRSNREQRLYSFEIAKTLKDSLLGHFPGARIRNEDRNKILALSGKITEQDNVASVSVVGDVRKLSGNLPSNEQFVQGIEKLARAMQGRQYIGMVIAESQSPQMIQVVRQHYQELYTKLSPLQKVQFTKGIATGEMRSQSFAEMNDVQKGAMLSGAAVSMLGAVGGAIVGALIPIPGTAMLGAMLGGQITGHMTGFINSLAPTSQINTGTNEATTTTTENKAVTDILKLIDNTLKRVEEFSSFGMWNVAGYFASEDRSTAEVAASAYRSLMSGENTGQETAAINVWEKEGEPDVQKQYQNLMDYLSRFMHPRFFYAEAGKTSVLTDPTTWLSGKELALHIGLPRATVPGFLVTNHPEFGLEVNTYQFGERKQPLLPGEKMVIGKVYDLGYVTDRNVELANQSLTMHTFVTGSTGSGKSNTVYQMLNELRLDGIPFLVVEPAKGEYKDVFGHLPDVNVFSTNPKIAPLINLNPFRFPDSIHVLEHVDGLVEIFSVCWPMYDAMPAFFKDAILKSYESVGWDLGSSTFKGGEQVYPDFETVADHLVKLIGESSYSEEIKSNYRGALITRVKSLTVGLNKFIFTAEQTPYEKLFDENCILDISRVKSSETKALLMGLMVYILNEYRMDRKEGRNRGLRHITVLEEAHNLLKNTSGRDSELIGKSVEMLTQTIAEIRTYGEGFIIVDQSPSSVDIAAIKNTNTKIILRTPEKNDREAVGRSMGLNDEQVNEIARLPTGVAVVYQNDWINPVLTKVDEASVQTSGYQNPDISGILSKWSARTCLLGLVMQAWFDSGKENEERLLDALKVLELPRKARQEMVSIIKEGSLSDQPLFAKDSDIASVSRYASTILDIKDEDFDRTNSLAEFETLVKERLSPMGDEEIDHVLNVLTFVEEG